MDIDNKEALGCLVVALFSVLAIVVAIAIGVFFGVGFGFLAYAAFVALMLLCCVIAFKQAK